MGDCKTPKYQRKQISQGNRRSLGRGCGESTVMIFGFRIGIGPVFASYFRNRTAARGRNLNGDKVAHDEIGHLALFFRRQRSNFIQDGLGICAHHSNYTSIAAEHLGFQIGLFHVAVFSCRSFSLRSAWGRVRLATGEQRICQTSPGQSWKPQRFGEHPLPSCPSAHQRRRRRASPGGANRRHGDRRCGPGGVDRGQNGFRDFQRHGRGGPAGPQETPPELRPGRAGVCPAGRAARRRFPCGRCFAPLRSAARFFHPGDLRAGQPGSKPAFRRAPGLMWRRASSCGAVCRRRCKRPERPWRR